ncbi:hypothetical protein, partial [Gemmiger formicilis]|uniref:hypothetical protein n=1 Tax=Gemmiger formicilis TaxID=745368 RepID=UPI003CCAA95C
MLITIANVPLTHAQMLQMASNLFTVSPPFIVFIIPHMCVVVNAFLLSFLYLSQLFICTYR